MRRALAVSLLVAALAAPAAAQDAARADVALAHGHRAEATEAYRALGGAPGHVGLGRVAMREARYDEAEAEARAAGTGVAATTLLGESLYARGRLEEAEAALRPLASDASAHRAHVWLGRVLLRRGRDAEARIALMQVIRAYNDHSITTADAEGLALVGMAAMLLGSAHDANDAFTQSARVDRQRVETELAWAELFLAHDDAGHAEECVRDARAASADDPHALALLARIRLAQSWDFGAARDLLDQALAAAPSLVGAHVVLAGMALRDQDLVTADRHLDDALAVDPTDPEALAVRAAVRFVANDTAGFERALTAARGERAHDAEPLVLVAEYGDWEHRYDELVTLARRALEIDPRSAHAQATLGINLLRQGDEEEGLAALRSAFARDAFNVRVFNLLRFFEGPIAREYETIEHAPFVFRMHREERAILERYVPRTLGAAYTDMRRRYRFTPRGPLHIELYATTQQFAVRTTGLPSLGAQGVCFGRLVTALSPRAGSFDWGEITTHELSHVFHVQMSHGRVPRWFTEGLAEHETTLARPEWRREDDVRLYRALVDGRFPPLRDLNTAFTHARSADAMLTAYYGGWRVVAYLDQRFGFRSLANMLREWGRGRTTEEVFQRVLHASIDDVDRDFRASELSRLASHGADFGVDLSAFDDLVRARRDAAADPDDAATQATLAASELAEGHATEALTAAQAAVRADPSEPTARFVLATLAVQRHDGVEAETHLAALRAAGRDGYDVAMLGAESALLRHDVAAERAALEHAVSLADDRIEAHHALFSFAREQRDDTLALREALRLVRLDEHGRDALSFALDTLAARGDDAGLDAIVPRIVFVDPERARGHELYARSELRLGHLQNALYEADSWLLLDPDHTSDVQRLRAEILHRLHREGEAREAEAAATGSSSH